MKTYFILPFIIYEEVYETKSITIGWLSKSWTFFIVKPKKEKDTI